MYLLDTNVVSELRKQHPEPRVVAWLSYQPSNRLNVSAITIAEIQRGIEQKRPSDPSKASELQTWLDDFVSDDFRVLPFDAAAAREWARLIHGQPNRLAYDGMIAAIAQVRELTVVTRNVKDFKQLGVEWLNPFERR